ncbi:MAG TPA: protoheme IX farnesyltransferase [Bacteroidales bacterium]|nr:protoheme IX farnesyltransferase [Bacteroidales bacterium]
MNLLSLVSNLVKLRLSIAVTLSAMTGFFISGAAVSSSLFFMLGGVFILTCGAAALNQFTEKDTDALMKRTAGRPIPSGRISAGAVLFTAILLIFSGILLLAATRILPVILGAVSVILYNFIYTRLKKITLVSVVPGALVGALPPLIGYFSAGMTSLSISIILFSAFMFLWQLPHFWLILIRYRADYFNAGFRTFGPGFTSRSIRILVFCWVLLTSLLLISFSLGRVLFNPAIGYSLAALNILFILSFYSTLFGRDEGRSVNGAFILINSFSLLIMILFILNTLIK